MTNITVFEALVFLLFAHCISTVSGVLITSDMAAFEKEYEARGFVDASGFDFETDDNVYSDDDLGTSELTHLGAHPVSEGILPKDIVITSRDTNRHLFADIIGDIKVVYGYAFAYLEFASSVSATKATYFHVHVITGDSPGGPVAVAVHYIDSDGVARSTSGDLFEDTGLGVPVGIMVDEDEEITAVNMASLSSIKIGLASGFRVTEGGYVRFDACMSSEGRFFVTGSPIRDGNGVGSNHFIPCDGNKVNGKMAKSVYKTELDLPKIDGYKLKATRSTVDKLPGVSYFQVCTKFDKLAVWKLLQYQIGFEGSPCVAGTPCTVMTFEVPNRSNADDQLPDCPDLDCSFEARQWLLHGLI